MESAVYEFLKKRYDKNRPVLLALSGGPDSLVLLHILLKFKNKLDLRLAIAHVDHCWRNNSTTEAMQLQELANQLEIPFHLKTLNPNHLSGNLEEACRNERLQFFKNLCDEEQYQAVLMAHHADDQAETVLKRVFEASRLTNLSGLREETDIGGLIIWRPLLNSTKNEILRWAEQHSLAYFNDYTNSDPKFLRGKFRTKIIPYLSAEFGKEVSYSLSRLAKEAQELGQYLEERIKIYLNNIVFGFFGNMLDLSEQIPPSPYERKYLLNRFCEISNFPISYAVLETLVTMIDNGVADKEFHTSQGTLFVDRRRIFIMKKNITFDEKDIPLRLGMQDFGLWSVQVETISISGGSETTNWVSAWKGTGTVVLPDGNYNLAFTNSQACYPHSNPISKWWTNAKVPAFMRNLLPVVVQDGKIVHEFLSGKSSQTLQFNQPALRVTLDYTFRYYNNSIVLR